MTCCMRSPGISGGPGGSCQRLVMAGFRMCAGGLMYRPSGPFLRRFRLCSDNACRQLLQGYERTHQRATNAQVKQGAGR